MECTAEDIAEIEEIMREKWAGIMEKKRYEGKVTNIQMIDYFGQVYASSPREFQFMLGDKILIKVLAEHVRDVVGDNIVEGLKYFEKRRFQR